MKGQLIKHPGMLDTCMEVLSYYKGSKQIKLKIRWINLGFNQSFYIFTNHNYVKINIDGLGDWLMTNTNNTKCYRYSNWTKLGGI